MSRAQVKKIVQKYAHILEANNYPFSAIYLFGSYAKGKARKNSDIDIAVISNKLKTNWNKHEDLLWRHTLTVDPRIEPIGYTEKDFMDASDPLVYEIKTNGIRIK